MESKKSLESDRHVSNNVSSEADQKMQKTASRQKPKEVKMADGSRNPEQAELRDCGLAQMLMSSYQLTAKIDNATRFSSDEAKDILKSLDFGRGSCVTAPGSRGESSLVAFVHNGGILYLKEKP